MAISAAGIGSGLDVNGLVSQIMAAERALLTQLKAKETSFNAKISGYGTLKSALAAFEEAAKKLSGSGLTPKTATSSHADNVSVTATGSAAPGNYTVKVTQLAERDKLISESFTSTTEKLGDGAMTITVAGKSVSIPPEGSTVASRNYSLEELRDVINSASAGVSASILRADATTSYLVITGNETGAANAVSITASGGMAKFATGTNSNRNQPNQPMGQTAQDAKIDIDGLVISRPTNSVSDVIDGVTFQLIKADRATSIDVKVAQNTTAAKEAVNGFVTAYNTLHGTFKSLSSYDLASKKGGVLNGESGVVSIAARLRAEMNTPVAGNSFETLSGIGITFQRDGKLAVNDEKMTKAMAEKPTDVAALFSGNEGYATRVAALIKDVTGTTGVIKNRTEGIQATLKGLSNSQAALETRLVGTEKRIRAQFVSLDALLGSMQSTSSFLSQQLASLPAYD